MKNYYENLSDVPEEEDFVFETDTFLGVRYTTDMNLAILDLRNYVSVIVWQKHHTRGWEKQ